MDERGSRKHLEPFFFPAWASVSGSVVKHVTSLNYNKAGVIFKESKATFSFLSLFFFFCCHLLLLIAERQTHGECVEAPPVKNVLMTR